MSSGTSNNVNEYEGYLWIKDLVVHTMGFVDERSLVNCKQVSKFFHECASPVLTEKLKKFFSQCVYKEPIFIPKFGPSQIRGCQLFVKSLMLPCWTRRSNELILKTFPDLEIKKESLPQYNQLNAQSHFLQNSRRRAESDFQKFVNDKNLDALHGCLDIYLMNPRSLMNLLDQKYIKECIEIATERKDKLLEAKACLAHTLWLNLQVTELTGDKEAWVASYNEAFLSVFQLFVDCFPAKELHATMKYIAHMVYQLNIEFPSASYRQQWHIVSNFFVQFLRAAYQNTEWNVLLAALTFFKNWPDKTNNQILKYLKLSLVALGDELFRLHSQLPSEPTTSAAAKYDLSQLITALKEYPVVPGWAFTYSLKLKSVDDIVYCFIRHQLCDTSPLFYGDTTQSLLEVLHFFSLHIQSVSESNKPNNLEYLKALFSRLHAKGLEHSNLVFNPQFNQALESIAIKLKVVDLQKVILTYDHPFCTSLNSLLENSTLETLNVFLKETSESINGNWQIEVGVLNQLIQIAMDTNHPEWIGLTEKIKRLMVQKNAALLQAIIDSIHV